MKKDIFVTIFITGEEPKDVRLKPPFTAAEAREYLRKTHGVSGTLKLGVIKPEDGSQLQTGIMYSLCCSGRQPCCNTATGQIKRSLRQKNVKCSILPSARRKDRPKTHKFVTLSSFEQSLPRLPYEVWEVILQKTDLLSCLTVCDLEACQFFIGPNKECCDAQTALDCAIEHGHHGGVQILTQKQGCNLSIDLAAKSGQYELIKWICDTKGVGCRATCSKKVMDMAAERGHLDIVKLLHENRSEGCTTFAMDMAANNGHLDVVKFLHENRHEGCTKEAMDNALRRGHTEIVMYLGSNRLEGCSGIVAILDDTISEPDTLELLKVLHRYNHKVCWCFEMHHAVSKGLFLLVKWLIETRGERVWCSSNVLLACVNRQWEMANLLWEQSRKDPAFIFSNAQWAVCLGAMKWVLAHEPCKDWTNLLRINVQRFSRQGWNTDICAWSHEMLLELPYIVDLRYLIIFIIRDKATSLQVMA